jgi:hypothetical protein
MQPMEATYYILSLLNPGVETSGGGKPVAEPEFRPFNLSMLQRSRTRTERPTVRSQGTDCCGARPRLLPV